MPLVTGVDEGRVASRPPYVEMEYKGMYTPPLEGVKFKVSEDLDRGGSKCVSS